jgi:hypothetical protein
VRKPIDWVWVRAWVDRWMRPYLLRGWFVLGTVGLVLGYVQAPTSFGFDARLYHAAAQAWVAGDNPWAVQHFWSVSFPAVSFAGPPPTLLPFVLLAGVSSDVVVLLVALLSASAAIWTLRRLQLPMWWLLFPPIAEGLWVGNLNICVVALLVAGGTTSGALATTLKVYAAVPLLLQGRWRPLVLAAVITLVSLPILPWGLFVTSFGQVSATLAAQSWHGVGHIADPLLVAVGGLGGLILLGRRRATWLAVPVLWPSTQLHYAVIGLPALASSPFLAAAASVRQPGLLALAVMVLAIWERRRALDRMAMMAATEDDPLATTP